jgi:hypothetical protein
LSAVGIAFAVEETLAEKLLGDITPPAFDKLTVVGHQDVLNMVGMRHQDRAFRT